MSSQPPVNAPPPQRGKDPWRLRGVHRAEPHLGEDDRSPQVVWAMAAGIVFLLAIVGGAIFFQARSPAPLPTSAPSATPTPPPTPGSNIASPTFTPAPATAVPTTPRPTAALVRYRVRAGDTLSEIAQKYNVTVRAIQQTNGLKNETIYEGEELVIPVAPPRP